MDIFIIFLGFVLLLMGALIEEPLTEKIEVMVKHFIWDKPWKKWQKVCILIINTLIALVAIMCVIMGVFWSFDAQPFKTWGIVLFIVGVCILLGYFLLWLSLKNANKDKQAKDKNATMKTEEVEEIEDYPRFEDKEPTPQIYYMDDDEINNNG